MPIQKFHKAPLSNEGVLPILINTDHINYLEPSIADQVGSVQIHLSGSKTFAVIESAPDVLALFPIQVAHLHAYDPRTNSAWNGRSVFVVVDQLSALVPMPSVNRVTLVFFDGTELVVQLDVAAHQLLSQFGI